MEESLGFPSEDPPEAEPESAECDNMQKNAVALTHHFLFLNLPKRPWPTEQPKVKFAEQVDTENEMQKLGFLF